jgi:two-component system sensor histidine kinase YesM
MAEDNNKLFQNLKEEHVQKEHYYYESLNAKLNPHFLFNTLNSIRWMAVIRKADNIRNCIDALAIILQYHLVDEGKEVPLSKECEIIKNYCYIQNIRYGNRCTLTLDISPLLEQTSIIKFILQPLVENCFKHAFPSTQMDCAIIITAQKEADLLAITVTDNGVGFSPKSLGLFADRQSDTSKKGGIGLLLIDSLIKSYYGGTYGLTIANLPHGSQVKIVVPLKEKKA